MQFIKWSEEEIALLNKLSDAGKDFEYISNEINKQVSSNSKGFPIRRSSKAVKRKKEKLSTYTKPIQSKEQSTVEDRWKAMKDIQKQFRTSSKYLNTGVSRKPPHRKILALSDIHFPFSRLDFLKEAIEDHKDAEVVILNGDILDGYIFSLFEKEKVVAAVDEYNCTLDFVHLLSTRFPKVVLTQGNHDVRPEKMLKKSGFSKESYGIFRPDLLGRIANGERLSNDASLLEKIPMKNVFYPMTESWWVQIGKTLFIHPHNRGSSKPGWTVSEWAKKFKDRLPPGSFDSIVCGHTHQVFKGVIGNTLLIEQGCLCDFMAYSWQPRQIFHSSAMNGYAVIYQDEAGNTDFNRSNFVYLGQLQPVDKPMFGGRNEPGKDNQVLL